MKKGLTEAAGLVGKAGEALLAGRPGLRDAALAAAGKPSPHLAYPCPSPCGVLRRLGKSDPGGGQRQGSLCRLRGRGARAHGSSSLLGPGAGAKVGRAQVGLSSQAWAKLAARGVLPGQGGRILDPIGEQPRAQSQTHASVSATPPPVPAPRPSEPVGILGAGLIGNPAIG